MIKAKSFEPSLVTLGNPERITDRLFVRAVFYNGAQPLVVQLPPIVVSRGLYEMCGKWFVDVLVPYNTVLNSFLNCLNAALNGTLPLTRTTHDSSGHYDHLRLRLLPNSATLGVTHARQAGATIAAIACVDRVGCNGHWEFVVDRIAPCVRGAG